MMKKFFLLFCGAAAVLISYACSMPPIELAIDKHPLLSVPLNAGSFNLSSYLSDALAESNPDLEGIEIYDMVNYGGAQAFLINYKMDLVDSFNPGEYLDDIKDQMDNMNNLNPGVDPIAPDPISIPKLTPDPITKKESFDMSDVIGTAESQLAVSPSPATVLFRGVGGPGIPIGTGKAEELPFPAELQTLNIDLGEDGAVFDTVKLASGKLILDFALTGPDGAARDSDIDISLNGITLQTVSGMSFGSTSTGPDIRLNTASSFSARKEFDLTGVVLNMNDMPQFKISGIADNYTGDVKFVEFDIILQPKIEGVKLRGATGLKIDDENLKYDLPEEITNAVKIDSFPDGLLNARIGNGSLEMKVTLPSKDSSNPEKTYFDGLNIAFNLDIKQEPLTFENKPFNGLNETITESLNFAGKEINSNPLNIDTESSSISLTQGDNGISFELWGDDFVRKAIPIDFDVNMEINSLELVRWKLEDSDGNKLIPEPDIPEIDFANIGEGESKQDISKFVKSISFDNEDIRLGLNFTKLPEALNNRLALRIECPELGFDTTTKPLIPGPNDFLNTATELTLAENGVAKKLPVKAAILPVIDGSPNPDVNYMELGPLELKQDEDTKLEIAAEVEFGFEWKEAEINLKAAIEESGTDTGMLAGEYPEKSNDWIDLYTDLGKNMHGFTFSDGVKAKIFLGGPIGLINKINPKLKFTAICSERINREDDDDDNPANWQPAEEELYNNLITVSAVADFPTLPGKNADGNYVYESTELPEGGMSLAGTFTDIVARTPKDMRFSYEMVLPEEFTVTPTMFDDLGEEESGGITAMVLLILPLELQAEKNAFFTLPATVMDNDKDIFGRKTTDGEHPDKPFLALDGVEIKPTDIDITIDFSSDFFKGARLYIDSAGRLLPDGVPLGSGKSMTVKFNSDDWDTFNEYIIKPEIKIEFEQERLGTNALKIPRDLLPNRIAVGVSGVVTIDMENMGTGSK